MRSRRARPIPGGSSCGLPASGGTGPTSRPPRRIRSRPFGPWRLGRITGLRTLTRANEESLHEVTLFGTGRPWRPPASRWPPAVCWLRPLRSRSNRPQARPARTSSGCRRRSPPSKRCSTWRRSRRRTTTWISAPATAARSSPPPSGAPRPWGSNTTPTWSSSPKRNAEKAGRLGESDVRQSRPVRNRFFQSDGHHALPAPRPERQAAAEDPQHAAGHAHRLQHVHDGRLGSR